MASNVKRLFNEFVPNHYELYLSIDRRKLTFDGQVEISGLKTGRPSKRITLHQQGLKITDVTAIKITKKDEETVVIDRVNTHDSYDEVRLHSPSMIYPGEYKIVLKFSGKINERMHGIYPSYFTNKDKKQTIVATQFESNHAREAFPCIDEPEAKATFSLTLEHESGLVALSNTDSISSKKISPVREAVSFATTPIMSTYLLAFVSGHMHSAEAMTKQGIRVRSWASVAQPKNSLNYSVNEAVRVLEFFTDYFQTPYPLNKCDQVALPDFESGAMENWGLITYREILLLADPGNRSLSSEQIVSLVVAHELSHQWFGNLVTMKWWDDLWLNESFATLMEHVALSYLHPDWEQWEQYAATDVVATSNRDIYDKVQPVRQEVKDPALIEALFDPNIVYAKGGRLLKMLLDYIGEQNFKKGLHSYFKKYAYSNASHDDLWQEFGTTIGQDIVSFMDPWLKQSGMPVVSITTKNKSIILSQKRFIIDADSNSHHWPIPLLANQTTEPDMFKTKSVVLSSDAKLPFVINSSGSGHYVSHYQDAKLLAAFQKSFINLQIPSETRINMLNDMMLLARKGEISIVDVLDLVTSCDKESREAVWQLINYGFSQAISLCEGDEAAELKLKQARARLLSESYKKLGWSEKPSESPNDTLLRILAIGSQISAEDNQAVQEALSKYRQTKDKSDINAELRALIYSCVVRFGTKAEFNELCDLYQKTQNSEIQAALTAALCSTRDIAQLKLLIETSIGNSGFVRTQDLPRWFAYLMRNHYSRGLAWNWLLENWPRITKLYGKSKTYDSFAQYSANPINTKAAQTKYHDFFESKRNNKVLDKTIAIAYSEIEGRVEWRERDEQLIKDFIAKY